MNYKSHTVFDFWSSSADREEDAGGGKGERRGVARNSVGSGMGLGGLGQHWACFPDPAQPRLRLIYQPANDKKLEHLSLIYLDVFF